MKSLSKMIPNLTLIKITGGNKTGHSTGNTCKRFALTEKNIWNRNKYEQFENNSIDQERHQPSAIKDSRFGDYIIDVYAAVFTCTVHGKLLYNQPEIEFVRLDK